MKYNIQEKKIHRKAGILQKWDTASTSVYYKYKGEHISQSSSNLMQEIHSTLCYHS